MRQVISALRPKKLEDLDWLMEELKKSQVGASHNQFRKDNPGMWIITIRQHVVHDIACTVSK